MVFVCECVHAFCVHSPHEVHSLTQTNTHEPHPHREEAREGITWSCLHKRELFTNKLVLPCVKIVACLADREEVCHVGGHVVNGITSGSNAPMVNVYSGCMRNVYRTRGKDATWGATW